VLLHPHPDFGGDRYNHVVDALYRRLPAAGVSALRFDFGSGDAAVAVAEAGAAIAAAPDPAVVLIGYSFGADVALGVSDQRVAGWFLVAPPLRLVDPASVGADSRPKALLVPEFDQYSPPARTRQVVREWRHATVDTVPGADHFLIGSTGAVVDAAVAWSDRVRRSP
jgi:uncharacterized protein